MDSLSLTLAIGFEGIAQGVTGSADLKTRLSQVARTAFTGASKMVYEQVGTPLTVGAGATTLLDLTTGLTSPLNESISGANAFAHVFGVLVRHDSESVASSITALNAAANPFQGPFGAGDAPTLGPGKWAAFGDVETGTGWAVDGTHKVISIVNNDGSNAATVSVFVLGTTT